MFTNILKYGKIITNATQEVSKNLKGVVKQMKTLFEYIYEQKEENTLEGILERFIAELSKNKDRKSHMYKTKLTEILNINKDKEFYLEMQSHILGIKNIAEKACKVLSNGRVIVIGRQKSIKSIDDKIRLFLKEEKSLDLIRDFFAYRIIVSGGNSEKERVDVVYKIVNEVIEYISSLDYIPCASKRTDEVYNNNTCYIPKCSGIESKNGNYVKDYIRYPKANGYQSVHVCFRNVKTGRCFEVQIRTIDEDKHAEKNTANHDDYKKSRYGSVDEIQYDKIKIYGFFQTNDGSYTDEIGLINIKKIF